MSGAERVRYLTGNYQLLQGLKWVPVGVWLLLDAGWWYWYETWQPVSGGLTLALALLLIWFIDVYYKRNFGRVVSAPASQDQNISLALLVATVFVAECIDGMLTPLVSLFVLTVAGLLLLYWQMTVGLQAHRTATVVVIAASSFLSLFGAASYEQFAGTTPLVVLGTGFIVVGVVDHLLLVCNMEPVPEK